MSESPSKSDLTANFVLWVSPDIDLASLISLIGSGKRQGLTALSLHETLYNYFDTDVQILSALKSAYVTCGSLEALSDITYSSVRADTLNHLLARNITLPTALPVKSRTAPPRPPPSRPVASPDLLHFPRPPIRLLSGWLSADDAKTVLHGLPVAGACALATAAHTEAAREWLEKVAPRPGVAVLVGAADTAPAQLLNALDAGLSRALCEHDAHRTWAGTGAGARGTILAANANAAVDMVGLDFYNNIRKKASNLASSAVVGHGLLAAAAAAAEVAVSGYDWVEKSDAGKKEVDLSIDDIFADLPALMPVRHEPDHIPADTSSEILEDIRARIVNSVTLQYAMTQNTDADVAAAHAAALSTMLGLAAGDSAVQDQVSKAAVPKGRNRARQPARKADDLGHGVAIESNWARMEPDQSDVLLAIRQEIIARVMSLTSMYATASARTAPLRQPARPQITDVSSRKRILKHYSDCLSVYNSSLLAAYNSPSTHCPRKATIPVFNPAKPPQEPFSTQPSSEIIDYSESVCSAASVSYQDAAIGLAAAAGVPGVSVGAARVTGLDRTVAAVTESTAKHSSRDTLLQNLPARVIRTLPDPVTWANDAQVSAALQRAFVFTADPKKPAKQAVLTAPSQGQTSTAFYWSQDWTVETKEGPVTEHPPITPLPVTDAGVVALTMFDHSTFIREFAPGQALYPTAQAVSTQEPHSVVVHEPVLMPRLISDAVMPVGGGSVISTGRSGARIHRSTFMPCPSGRLLGLPDVDASVDAYLSQDASTAVVDAGECSMRVTEHAVYVYAGSQMIQVNHGDVEKVTIRLNDRSYTFASDLSQVVGMVNVATNKTELAVDFEGNISTDQGTYAPNDTIDNHRAFRTFDSLSESTMIVRGDGMNLLRSRSAAIVRLDSTSAASGLCLVGASSAKLEQIGQIISQASMKLSHDLLLGVATLIPQADLTSFVISDSARSLLVFISEGHLVVSLGDLVLLLSPNGLRCLFPDGTVAAVAGNHVGIVPSCLEPGTVSSASHTLHKAMKSSEIFSFLAHLHESPRMHSRVHAAVEIAETHDVSVPGTIYIKLIKQTATPKLSQLTVYLDAVASALENFAESTDCSLELLPEIITQDPPKTKIFENACFSANKQQIDASIDHAACMVTTSTTQNVHAVIFGEYARLVNDSAATDLVKVIKHSIDDLIAPFAQRKRKITDDAKIRALAVAKEARRIRFYLSNDALPCCLAAAGPTESEVTSLATLPAPEFDIVQSQHIFTRMAVVPPCVLTDGNMSGANGSGARVFEFSAPGEQAVVRSSVSDLIRMIPIISRDGMAQDGAWCAPDVSSVLGGPLGHTIFRQLPRFDDRKVVKAATHTVANALLSVPSCFPFPLVQNFGSNLITEIHNIGMEAVAKLLVLTIIPPSPAPTLLPGTTISLLSGGFTQATMLVGAGASIDHARTLMMACDNAGVDIGQFDISPISMAPESFLECSVDFERIPTSSEGSDSESMVRPRFPVQSEVLLSPRPTINRVISKYSRDIHQQIRDCRTQSNIKIFKMASDNVSTISRGYSMRSPTSYELPTPVPYFKSPEGQAYLTEGSDAEVELIENAVRVLDEPLVRLRDKHRSEINPGDWTERAASRAHVTRQRADAGITEAPEIFDIDENRPPVDQTAALMRSTRIHERVMSAVPAYAPLPPMDITYSERRTPLRRDPLAAASTLRTIASGARRSRVVTVGPAATTTLVPPRAPTTLAMAPPPTIARRNYALPPSAAVPHYAPTVPPTGAAARAAAVLRRTQIMEEQTSIHNMSIDLQRPVAITVEGDSARTGAIRGHMGLAALGQESLEPSVQAVRIHYQTAIIGNDEEVLMTYFMVRNTSPAPVKLRARPALNSAEWLSVWPSQTITLAAGLTQEISLQARAPPGVHNAVGAVELSTATLRLSVPVSAIWSEDEYVF